jgi:hypothetical protein
MKEIYSYRGYTIRRVTEGVTRPVWNFSFAPLSCLKHKTMTDAKKYIDDNYNSAIAIFWRKQLA